MPIHHMLYRCPRCGHDPLEGHKARAACPGCRTCFEQGRGATLIVRPPDGPTEVTDASRLLATVEERGGPGVRTNEGQEVLVREAEIRFGVVQGHDVIRWRGMVFGFSERVVWKGERVLTLEGEALTVSGDGGVFSWGLSEIRGVQISSRALQITLRGSRMNQFEFIDDSPKRWEDLICTALSRFYARSGRSVVEFKPRIVLMGTDEVSSPEGADKPVAREPVSQRERGRKSPR